MQTYKDKNIAQNINFRTSRHPKFTELRHIKYSHHYPFYQESTSTPPRGQKFAKKY